MRVMLHDGRLKHSKVKTIAQHYVFLFHSAISELCKHCKQIFLDCVYNKSGSSPSFASTIIVNGFGWARRMIKWDRELRMGRQMGTNCTSGNDSLRPEHIKLHHQGQLNKCVFEDENHHTNVVSHQTLQYTRVCVKFLKWSSVVFLAGYCPFKILYIAGLV